MTSGHQEASHGRNDGTRWLTAIGSLAVGAIFLALWFWLLPIWLGFQVDLTGVARWRRIAAVPSVLGFAVALRCIWISHGPDKERRRRLLLRKDSCWWVSTAMCGTRCTWGFSLAGWGCG